MKYRTMALWLKHRTTLQSSTLTWPHATFASAADNMLLSEDGKDTYLCDFGHSRTLEQNAKNARISAGNKKQMRPQHQLLLNVP